MNFLSKMNEIAVLAQYYSDWSFKSIATTVVVVIAVIALIGVFLQTGIKKYIEWVPQWFWAMAGIVVIAFITLWFLGKI